MTPGSLERIDGHTFFYPTIPGSVSPRAKGHTHILRVQAYTIEGPQKALMGCADCSKTFTVVPNPRIRVMPEGFTETAWANFLAAAARRKEELDG